MARAPDERIKQAEDLFNQGFKLIDISKELGIPEGTVRCWKNRYKWGAAENATLQKSKRNVAKKHGGQPGNQNAKGHGAPARNKNAETHGFFSKYLPEETLAIMEEIQQKDPLDILWENITIQYTAIVRAQRIMYVRDKDDKTTTKIEEKDGNVWGQKWEVQHAWDKQANFLQAQSRAMAELRSMIKQYDELLKSGLATEEQKLRVEKLKVEIDKIRDEDKDKPIEVVIKRAEKRAGDAERS